MTKIDEQDVRISAVVGNDEESSFDDAIGKFYAYLGTSLKLPCDVTGIEDFDWEEYYIFGPGDATEYAELRKTQPSYQDIFELQSIEKDVDSEWMMYHREDLAARVLRKSDGKEFLLGLAEIKAVDRKSPNYQLLDDYATWFVNNR